jgi:hypothetical protein
VHLGQDILRESLGNPTLGCQFRVQEGRVNGLSYW